MVALINGLSSVGRGSWSCLPLPASPAAQGSGTSTFLGWQGHSPSLDQPHFQLGHSGPCKPAALRHPCNEIQGFQAATAAVLCSGQLLMPTTNTYACSPLGFFVSWSHKGQMSLLCPNKNPSVVSGCLKHGAGWGGVNVGDACQHCQLLHSPPLP